MFWLIACPKCLGDLYKGSDDYGLYIACLQCSRYLNPSEQTQLELITSKSGPWSANASQVEKLVA